MHDFSDEVTKEECLNPNKIFWHYLRSWFVIDFVSSVPFGVFFDSQNASFAKTFKIIRVIRILKLARVVKLMRLDVDFITRHVNPFFFRLAR